MGCKGRCKTLALIEEYEITYRSSHGGRIDYTKYRHCRTCEIQFTTPARIKHTRCPCCNAKTKGKSLTTKKNRVKKEQTFARH